MKSRCSRGTGIGVTFAWPRKSFALWRNTKLSNENMETFFLWFLLGVVLGLMLTLSVSGLELVSTGRSRLWNFWIRWPLYKLAGLFS